MMQGNCGKLTLVIKCYLTIVIIYNFLRTAKLVIPYQYITKGAVKHLEY